MKILLDENIPPVFVEKIKTIYPDSIDIYDINYSGKSDKQIYEYLMDHQYVLLTFDLDFADIRKFPPENVEGIIVLRFRNKKILNLMTNTISYLSKLNKLDYKGSLVIFQNSGIRIKKLK